MRRLTPVTFPLLSLFHRWCRWCRWFPPRVRGEFGMSSGPRRTAHDLSRSPVHLFIRFFWNRGFSTLSVRTFSTGSDASARTSVRVRPSQRLT